jgi:hypothetical protein
MKLDEEMRARCDAAYREFATAAEGKFVDGVSHMFLAGYRMGLERAAKVCDGYAAKKWDEYKRGNGPGRAHPQWQGESDGAHDCAAAIREMAHD